MRRYRYGEPRRAGLFGTLAWTMLVPLIAALAAAWLAVAGFVPPPFAVPVVAAGVWLAFGRVRGRPAHAVLPAMAGVRVAPAAAPASLVPAGSVAHRRGGAGGAAAAAGRAGTVRARRDRGWCRAGPCRWGWSTTAAAHTVTAVLRVHGDGQFSLLDALDQDVRLDGWGAALGGFARERCDVVRVAWHDWAAPVPVADQIGQLQSRWADEPVSPARSSYLALMDVVAPKVTEHDLLLEVTVAVARRRQAGRPTGLAAALATLSDELALFCVPARRRRAAGRRGAVGGRRGDARPGAGRTRPGWSSWRRIGIRWPPRRGRRRRRSARSTSPRS